MKNYLNWCSVRVNTGAASAGAMQTVCVPPGANTVAAAPLNGFRLGTAPWHGTTGDTGTGEAGNRVGTEAIATATVVSGTPKCVWVCCEFAAGGGCDGLANQCP